MSGVIQQILGGLGSVLSAIAMAYALAACVGVRAGMRSRSARAAAPQPLPAVTVLKPLCGAEHDLYGSLRSFCEQDYSNEAGPGRFQIVFGVRDPQDPAVAVVRKLQEEFPALDLQLTIDPRQHGSSGKVSNLINMLPLARHDFLVLADSDVRVPTGYLSKVVPPLQDPGVGLVTCPYLGRPRDGPWSLLGSLFINDWFMPSVRVAALFGSREFVSGVTIALRRETLASIGGFAAVANQLADDYRLGELTRRLGLRTVLSEVVVETCVDEHTGRQLIEHELRWLRTIRVVRPVGYALMFPTFSLPLSMLGAALGAAGEGPLSAPGTAAIVTLAVTALARVMLHSAPARAEGRRYGPTYGAGSLLWAAPVSDTLAFALWCWGFTARHVQWRHARYRVARDGSVHPVP